MILSNYYYFIQERREREGERGRKGERERKGIKGRGMKDHI